MPEHAPMPPHIRYHAPPGGHVILRRHPRDAYEALVQFLHRCTTWNGQWTFPSLDVSGAGPYMNPDYDPAPLKAEIERELAHGRDGGGIANFDAGTGELKLIQSKRTWEVPQDRHQWALDLVFRQPPIGQYDLPPVSYSFGTRFLLKHPDGRVLPTWPPACSAGLGQWALHHDCWMSGGADPSRVHAYFELVFPFDEPAEPFLDLVRVTRPHMPWRLSRANFRLVLPSRGKQGYTLRKIDKALFADL